MAHRLTIKDIAQLSGVGKSTVSRVLNNEHGVNRETRQRVLAVIEQYNFIPNKSARVMRGASDKVIAIIVSRLDSPSEHRTMQAMLPLFQKQGYNTLVMESRFSPQQVTQHLNTLKLRGIDGVVLFSFAGLAVEELAPWKSRIVLVAHHYAGFSSVCYDDQGAVSLLLNQLWQQGHKHIGYIGAPQQDATTGQLRTQSYLAFCQQHALPAYLAQGEISYQSGERLTEQLLHNTPLSAIVCATDTLALGVMKYLQHHAHPEIKVCGIGHNPLLSFIFPETISVELGYSNAGQCAATLLIDKLEQDGGEQQVIIPCQLSE